MLIHNADITGSLLVNGTGYNTGSFSGSFIGAVTGITATASYVEYNNVANKPALVSGSSQITYSGLTGIPSGIVSGSAQVSFNGIVDKPTLVSGSEQISFNGIVDKPTLVSGSSQITYSGLTGIPSGIVSGSAQISEFGIFATTGSNGFNGSQSITGSLTVTGQVVAQTLNVQQVTSSIVYSSGSNIFGNSLANTQQFTGSVGVTGSLTVNGAGTLTGPLTGSSAAFSGAYGSSNGISLSGTTYAMYGANRGATNASAGMNYFSTGSQRWFSGIYENSDNFGIYSVGTGGFPLILNYSTGAATFSSSVTAGGNVLVPAGSGLAWSGGASRIMTPEDNVQGAKIATPGGFLAEASVFKFIGGNVGIGTASPSTLLDVRGTGEGIYVARIATNDNGSHVRMQKARGSVTSPTIVSNGDTLGSLTFEAYNGSSYSEATGIRGVVNGAVSAGSTPTDLFFSAGASGTTAANEHMRITSAGNIGINTSSPTTYSLAGSHVENFGGNNYAFIHNNTTTVKSFLATNESALLTALFTFSAHPLTFGTSNTQRMRITSGGDLIKVTHSGVDGTYDGIIRYMANGDIGVNNNRWIGMDATITAGSASTNAMRFRVYQGNAAQDQPPLTAMTLNGLGDAGIAGSLTLGTAETSNTDIRINNATNSKSHYVFSDASSGDLGIESGIGVGIKFNTNGPNTKVTIASGGDITINGGTISNSGNYKANTFIQLTSVATKTFSVSGPTQGNFAVTDFSGVPSNAKALLVYGWYHITGYNIGSGQGDHAVSWFGLANGVSPYSWSGPGNPWPGDNSSFTPAYYGSFAMDHDGDSSVGSSNINYYGTWHNGIINVNANGTVYHTLAHGYSGGTHHIALYCVGYWV